jgi:hypothetical protein
MSKYAICLDPTITFTKGKEYKIVVEGAGLHKVINDNGDSIWVSRFRFAEPKEKNQKKENNMKKVICDTDKFNNIKKGKEYEVLREMDDFYIIRNEKGYVVRYWKKNFKDKIDLKKPEKIKKEKVVDNRKICIIPTARLTYKKKYEVKDDLNDPSKYIVRDDLDTEISVLKARFA